jgi:hypothetical protein
MHRLPHRLLTVARTREHVEHPFFNDLATMKNLPLLLPAVLAGLICLTSPLAVAQTTIYEDNFNGDAGTLLSGRAPDIVNTTGSTFVASAEIELDGVGNAVSTNGGGVASISLPTLNDGDVITVTAAIRPVSSADPGNWIAIGFSPDATAGLWKKGTAWALLRGGPSNKRQGFLHVFPGPGVDPEKIYASTEQEPEWGGLGATQLTLSYAVSTGKLTATIGTHTVFDDVISYNGQAGTPAPQGDLQNVILQWHRQGTPGGPPVGWIESFSVSITKGGAAAP